VIINSSYGNSFDDLQLFRLLLCVSLEDTALSVCVRVCE
jgi:hypothetical protein